METRKLIPLFLLSLLFAFPVLAVATASGSPGTTTTLMGMPVVQTFSGLTASTAYDVVLIAPGSNVTVADGVSSDGSGKLVVSIGDYNDYGSNTYVVELDASPSTEAYRFSINNMDILPYLIPVIVIAVIFSLMKAFTKF